MKRSLILLNLLIVISVANSINSFYKKNACKDRTPDRQLMELSQVYATFTCDKDNYGRGRIISCNFYHKLPDAEEEGVEHFLCTVLIKGKEKQNNSIGVGEFIKWPDSASPVQCKSDINTAIINKDDKTKENITFAWKSPAEDLGELYFSMSYSGSQYHTEVRKNLKFIDFPVSLKECGNRKNCMRYASENKDCDADNCKYAITYGFFDTYRNTVKFTFDIQEDKNSFLAIAFTKNDPKESNMNGTNVFACIKHSKDVNAESYIIDEKNKLVKSKMMENFQSSANDYDKNYFGCKFDMPVKVPGKNALDLNEEYYQLYFWGELDKDTGIPILPEKLERSEKAHNLETFADERFTNSGPKNGVNLISLLCIFVLYLVH